jgi:type I restriction enzyme S subunit
MGNIGIGQYLDKSDNAKYFYQKDFDELKANEIFPGDILISRLADPAGRSIILPDLGSRMVTAVDVAIIRPSEKFDSYFLLSSLNSSKVLAKVDALATGSTRKRISRKNLELISLKIPKNSEQKKIGQILSKIDQLIASNQRNSIRSVTAQLHEQHFNIRKRLYKMMQKKLVKLI